MKLAPIAATAEPTYPTFRSAAKAWRTLAAAVAVSASFLLPACGDDESNAVAVPGGMQPVQVEPVDAPKPPEPVVKPPEQPIEEPRLSGARAAPAPPVRLPGEAPALAQ
jgi:hypothetical protein